MTEPETNPFNIEHQYQKYLEMSNLKESKMHEEQRKQLRQTFYGACGQMLLMFRDDLTKEDGDKAIEHIVSMIRQVSEHFRSVLLSRIIQTRKDSN